MNVPRYDYFGNEIRTYSQIRKEYLKDHPKPIPDGHEIYQHEIGVVWVSLFKAYALDFVEGRSQAIKFVTEPDNPVDPNAIAVWGMWVSTRGGHNQAPLGYVPAPMAKFITDKGIVKSVLPRLEYFFRSKTGYVEILYQITGPGGGAEYFRRGSVSANS